MGLIRSVQIWAICSFGLFATGCSTETSMRRQLNSSEPKAPVSRQQGDANVNRGSEENSEFAPGDQNGNGIPDYLEGGNWFEEGDFRPPSSNPDESSGLVAYVNPEVETAKDGYIRGYVYDEDDESLNFSVEFYIRGEKGDGGIKIGETIANESYGGLNANRGFSFLISSSSRVVPNSTHDIYTYVKGGELIGGEGFSRNYQAIVPTGEDYFEANKSIVQNRNGCAGCHSFTNSYAEMRSKLMNPGLNELIARGGNRHGGSRQVCNRIPEICDFFREFNREINN